MDLRDLEKVIKESEGGIEEKKENLISNMKKEGNPRHLFDSASALQLFLDRIPISSIPGLQNSASGFHFPKLSLMSVFLHRFK